jgi:hypothetical protein
MECPPGTVKSRLNYARQQIKSGVEDYEKKGIKLYGVASLPVISMLLKEQANIMQIPPSLGSNIAPIIQNATHSQPLSGAGSGSAGSSAGNVGAGTGANTGASATAGSASSSATGGTSTAATVATSATSATTVLSTKIILCIVAAVLAIGVGSFIALELGLFSGEEYTHDRAEYVAPENENATDETEHLAEEDDDGLILNPLPEYPVSTPESDENIQAYPPYNQYVLSALLAYRDFIINANHSITWFGGPELFNNIDSIVDATLIDFDGDGIPEMVLFFDASTPTGPFYAFPFIIVTYTGQAEVIYHSNNERSGASYSLHFLATTNDGLHILISTDGNHEADVLFDFMRFENGQWTTVHIALYDEGDVFLTYAYDLILSAGAHLGIQEVRELRQQDAPITAGQELLAEIDRLIG